MKWIQLIALCQCLLSSLVFAEAQAAPAGKPGGMTALFPLLLMGLVMYFLMIRPQHKKQKQHQQFLSSLKRGDMVVTNGGIVGTVRTTSDKFVTLEVDENVCLKVVRGQILESANSLRDEKPKTLETKTTPA